MTGTKHLHSLTAGGAPAASVDLPSNRRRWVTPRVIVGSQASRVAGAGKSGTTVDKTSGSLTIMTFGPAS